MTGRDGRERAATLVEALIVISTFILILLGMIFFKEMYMKQIQTARLARASVMAFSMQGCPDGQNAAGWASVDLNPGAGRNTPPPNNTIAGTPNSPKPNSRRANAIMKSVPGGGTEGGVLNPIADFRLSLEASTTTKTSKFGARKGFTRTMGSTSYVSCGEGIRDDSFESVMKYALDKFHLGKGACDPNATICGDD